MGTDCKSVGNTYAGSNPVHPKVTYSSGCEERIAGFEPAPFAWKAKTQPLCNIHIIV